MQWTHAHAPRRVRGSLRFGCERLDDREMLSLLAPVPDLREAIAAGAGETCVAAKPPAFVAEVASPLESPRLAIAAQVAPRAAEFVSTGRNRYFILEPNHTLVLEGNDDGQQVLLTITVLNETQIVDGVETRVVEERETADGDLVEVSRNFFAIDRTTNDVYYFGEDVDIYENGQIVSHDGAWRSGVDGAQFGLFMPANPRRGMRFAQENAPGVAEDRAKIVGIRRRVRTPAGSFFRVLAVRETSPLDRSASRKLYAPGIGLIQDDVLKLTGVTRSFDFTATGRNTHFILEPGHSLALRGTDDGEQVDLTITVLDKTQIVDGVETRVVEERETVNGELAEVSRNFFAVDRHSSDVFYFGEDVDIYQDGQVVSHDGAWRSGVNGARFGLFMPADPLAGMKFAQENAPGVAEDQAHILGFRRRVRTPAGVFRKVLAVRETSPLDRSASRKLYAPGIGLIADGKLRLVAVTGPAAQ